MNETPPPDVAQTLRRKWGPRLDRFALPCPLCRGEMRFHGIGRERVYEFSESAPDELSALTVEPLTFICTSCGFTSDFDAELFNPAHLAQLQGAPPEHVAALSFRDYQVLVPLAGTEKNDTLLDLASAIAGVHRGEVLALHVTETTGNDEALAERLRRQVEDFVPAPGNPAPLRLLQRRGGDVGDEIVATAADERVELLLAGWRGWTTQRNAHLGRVLDTVLSEALSDVAFVHDRGLPAVECILLPTAGGPHARVAARLAFDIARAYDAELHMLYVAPPREPDPNRAAQAVFARTLHDVWPDLDEEGRERLCSQHVTVHADPVQAIVEASAAYDLLMLGTSPRKWFGRVYRGDLALKIARNANPTSIVVSARKTLIRSWINRLIN